MADLLKLGAEFLATVRKAAYSVPVTLKRGSDSTPDVQATLARHEEPRVDDATGVVVLQEHRDFKVAVADYQIGGTVVEPAQGDVIVDSSSGDPIEYTVLPIAGEDEARWADRYGVTWRIHTKRLS